ncbi:MAG: hypothetical protein JXL84_01085 [Deltaproteobacteria bacterium]|nr:hypothetical protein [Deltaproteobacteria bacterium]
MSPQRPTFQQALDAIESLPEYQQDNIIAVVRRRRIEHRRDLLAKQISQARAEFRSGRAKRGNVEDLMKELRG